MRIDGAVAKNLKFVWINIGPSLADGYTLGFTGLKLQKVNQTDQIVNRFSSFFDQTLFLTYLSRDTYKILIKNQKGKHKRQEPTQDLKMYHRLTSSLRNKLRSILLVWVTVVALQILLKSTIVT